jgi:uncharacterized membrane protein
LEALVRILLWIGVVLIVLGIASFFVAVPQKQHEGIKFGGASVGVETTTSEKLPVYASVIILVGGISMVLAGSRSSSR